MLKLCIPSILYLVLSITSIIPMFLYKIKISAIIVHCIVVAIWTWFLNFLCNKNLEGLSWFLVILPSIILLLLFFFAYKLLSNISSQELDEIKKEFQNDLQIELNSQNNSL